MRFVATLLFGPFTAGTPNLPPVRLSGLATVYYRGDGMSGPHLGCVRAARRILGHNRFTDDLPVIATRRGPACGTLVMVEHARTGARTWAWRLDSGPWSCYAPDGARTVALQCPNGKRRSIADLSLRVAREIGHDGYDPIRLRWHRPVR